MGSIRELPAPDDYKEEEPEPVPVAPAVRAKQEGDLVDLREDSATADEQGNKLALALFSGPAAAAPTNATGNYSPWEAFPSDGGTEATSARETPAAEPGKADWELVLVETASSLSKQKAALGGDLFAASLSMKPAAYVQMAEMEKKQEQQVWVHYQRDGMQSPVNWAKLDNGNGYGFVPNTAVPYKMPAGYKGSCVQLYDLLKIASFL